MSAPSSYQPRVNASSSRISGGIGPSSSKRRRSSISFSVIPGSGSSFLPLLFASPAKSASFGVIARSVRSAAVLRREVGGRQLRVHQRVVVVFLGGRDAERFF